MRAAGRPPRQRRSGDGARPSQGAERRAGREEGRRRRERGEGLRRRRRPDAAGRRRKAPGRAGPRARSSGAGKGAPPPAATVCRSERRSVATERSPAVRGGPGPTPCPPLSRPGTGRAKGTASGGPSGPARRERSDRSRRPRAARRGTTRPRPFERSETATREVERRGKPVGRSGSPRAQARADATHGPGAERTGHVTRRRGAGGIAASTALLAPWAAPRGAEDSGRRGLPGAPAEGWEAGGRPPRRSKQTA